MARKRMISPEIWESQNFSALSDVAKIVFISLFSHADDEGRGRADPTFVKNKTFPYDEGRRVADIKSALSEIARSMSVQFYSVNGIEYYFMTSWGRWQKIDKPSKSKFPPPPIVGEGGGIHSTEEFDEHSTSIRRTLDEHSSPNRIRIEDNIIPPLPPKGEARGDREEFLKLYPALKPKGDDSFLDYSKLKDAFSRSQYLRRTYSFKWMVEHYEAIIQGAYEDKKDEKCDADKNTDKERFYASRRNTAIATAEKAKRLAEQDEAYKSADKLFKQTEIKILKAERTAPQTLPDLQRVLEEAKANRATALKRLNLTDDDFVPKYACAKCWDTGYMADGTPCDCYHQN